MNETGDDSEARSKADRREVHPYDNIEEMRNRFWLSVLALFVVVFGLELYQAIVFPGAGMRYNTDYPAAAFGGTLGTLFLSGIAPMLWFGVVRKFDYHNQGGPLFLWCVLAAYLWWQGYSVDKFNHCVASAPFQECL